MLDFDTLKNWVSDSWTAQGEWREACEENKAFEAGHQWTDSEKADMQEQSRIPIVFNRTAVIISSVEGSEINNRTEVRFIPREIGDVKPNEVLTAGGEWFRDQADAEDADSEAFHDLLVCGLGVTDTGLDWDADPEGEPMVEAMDLLHFGWDHHARKKGLTNARYFFELVSKPKEEMQERFPNEEPEALNADWLPSEHEGKKSINHVGDEYAHGDNDGEEDPKELRVVRIQYRQRARLVEYVNPQTGQRDTMPAKTFKAVSERVPLAMASREFTKWEWHQAFLGRDKVLDRNQPDPDGPTFNVMTGKWDRKEKRFYGLLESMKDPQKFANKWLSQTLHIINSNSKGGVMMEADAALDQQQFEESWAAADSVTWLKKGALSGGKVQEKPKADMPVALMSLTEFAISAIRDTSGVNLELLGMRDANQPGVLEYQRRQSAMTTQASYFDALRFYRKRQGHTILNILRNYIAPTGRLVRVVKEDQVQYVPLALSDDAQKYDVIIDDAPSAPNEKEKAWSVIQAMMPMLQNAGLSLEDWADVLEYSPLPSSFADKVREKAAKQREQGPDPMAQRAQQLELAKLESEVAENTSNATLDAIRTQQIAQEAQLAPFQTAADILRAQPSPAGVSPA